ncbi:MAG: SIS domain-containing protein [Verrucomicrobiota bacterium]
MIESLIGVLEKSRLLVPAVERTGLRIADCLSRGGKVLACGNGGSASDALHLCEELTGRYRKDRKPLPAVSLAADGTALTCIANDFGFEQVFARQLAALGETGDLLVAFSTSGQSPNILQALDFAKNEPIHSIALLGNDGGEAANLADEAIVVPSTDSARIQEVHTLILHSWLEIVEEKLFGFSRSGE